MSTKKTDTDKTRKGRDKVNDEKEADKKTRLKLVTDLGRTGLVDPALTTKVTNYDAATIDRFLDVILHAGQDDSEELPFWRCPVKTPKIGYPITEETFYSTTLNGTYDAPARCYIGTSTLTPCKQGLRNRGEQIVTTRMVVLDDIGTKVPIEKIHLPPTYIIESSAGNFQYGYVFDKPIDKPDAAAELVSLLYNAGLSDAGGKMANKLVRLPCGVNGKAAKHGETGNGTLFEVTLKELHPDRIYSPQEILDGLGLNDSWQAIYDGAREHAQARANDGEGASLWTHAVMPTYKGVVDPVLEWLVEQNMFESDNGEFVTIRCPNAAEHTNGDGTAGYRPVGRGSEPHTRAFHCFHDHCSHFTTADFLAYVSANGGPQAAVRDEAAHLTSEWVYDAHNNGAWQIQNTKYPRLVSMEAFKNLHPYPVEIVGADGKTKTVKQYHLWHNSRSRVNVSGQTYNPADPSRLVPVDGHLMVNAYTPPTWGDGVIHQHDVDMFLEFLEYLIPVESERDYFLDWLACKAQNMGFRGAAIVMIAPQQGTGRTTMADMLAAVFGEHNRINVPFDKLIGDSQFNEWQEYPLVVTDETLNTGESNYYRTYERLKELVDPRPKQTSINPKYGRKRQATVYSSYLMFSNHVGALALGETDRRFYVISNVYTPASGEYFARLNAWLQKKNDKGEPAWCASIWRWLRKREVVESEMLLPPATTEAKRQMMEDSRSPISAFVACYVRALNQLDMVAATANQVIDMAERFDHRLNLSRIKNYEGVLKKEFRTETITVPKAIRLHGKNVVRCRLTKQFYSFLTPEERLSLAQGGMAFSSVNYNAIQESCEQGSDPDMREKLFTTIGSLLGDYEL